MTKSWSLARRLTVLYAVGTLVIVLASALVGDWYLRKSVERELSTLTVQGLESAEAYFMNSPHTKEDFVEALRLSQIVNAPVAWRVWDPDTGAVWGEFGKAELLEKAAPATTPHDVTVSAPDGLRWRSTVFTSRHVVAIVVDGSERLALLTQYQRFSIPYVLVSILLALAGSWYFARRVSTVLRRVAEDVRSDRDDGDPIALDTEGAPEEIREVAEALRERLARVRVESEQARLFTASLAHELRSPIQNLVGETEVTLIAPRDAATYKRVLESHLQELRELGDAVDNLLTMCAARATDSKILNEEFDLAEEAELRLAREKSRARLEDVRLDLRRTGDMRLVGDREALLRALRNLAANAIEWSPPGARIDLHLEGRDGHVVVTVDDQGPGVPPELRERIFEPFFTGPARKGGRVGYGLGLAIARAAAISQGGEIEVGSSASGGARFRLVLPRRVGLRKRTTAAVPDKRSAAH